MAIAEKPALARVRFGDLAVTRLIVGGNPFSGFSHQTGEADQEMMSYYTAERIKEVYRQAEQAGVNTCIARTDRHMIRLLREYWEEGGTIQWIGQTAPELGPAPAGIRAALAGGAKGIFVHGGETDHLHINGRLDDLKTAIKMIHDAGLPAGIAGHRTVIFEWAEANLDCDFYMCSYYDPTDRGDSPEAKVGDQRFLPEMRDKMTAFIPTLSKPVIHYKILAAGRNNPQEAFARAARSMRSTDAVCVGIYTKHRPNEVAEDVAYLKAALKAVGQEG